MLADPFGWSTVIGQKLIFVTLEVLLHAGPAALCPVLVAVADTVSATVTLPAPAVAAVHQGAGKRVHVPEASLDIAANLVLEVLLIASARGLTEIRIQKTKTHGSEGDFNFKLVVGKTRGSRIAGGLFLATSHASIDLEDVLLVLDD